MIRFKSKSKRQKITAHNSEARDTFIKPTDANFKDIIVNGVCLPGYQKLSHTKRKKQAGGLASTSLEQTKQKTSPLKEQEQKQEQSGLFKNSAIRTRLKSFQVEISISAKPVTLERKHSMQRDIATSQEQFVKSSNIMYPQPKSERYISEFTALNWPLRKSKTNHQRFSTEPTKCGSTSQKTQDQLLHKQSVGTPNKANHLQIFNDCLLAHCHKYLCLNNSEGSKDIQPAFIFNKQSNSLKSSSFEQPGCLAKTRNKVCYSIKLRNEQQKQTTDPSQLENGKWVANCEDEKVQ